MPWTTTHDPGEFLTAARGFVRSRLIEHNMILSITARLLRAGRPGPGEPPLLGWWAEEPGPRGAFIATASFPLAVTPMPAQALDELADTLVPPLLGIGAQAGAAGGSRGGGRAGPARGCPCTAASACTGSVSWCPLTRRRPAAPGGLQTPTAACCTPGTLRSWPNWAAPRSRDVPAQVTDRLGYGGLVLWEAGGVPVSMAGRTQVTAGICKVAPVYTPPQQRGHGYGTAATAAVTRHAIETGAPEILLFTDATNPVTNPIYQRLGYHPAEDRLILTFT
jgi:GNAT superfamily N-acetyltransferase